MTDGLKGLIPRTRELGRLRAGHQEPVLDDQGRQVKNRDGSPKFKPVKRTTWRLTSPSEELLHVAAGLYGGEVEVWADAPTQGRQYQLATERESIEVMIPLTEAALSQAFELWSGGGCQRRCDGERMTDDEPCMCPADIEERMAAAAKPKPEACKPTTRLNVLLPDIPDLGFWRLEAHGYNAAVELPGTLALFTGLARTYGDGLQIVRAHLRIDARTSKKDGQTRHFTVPVIEVPTLTPRALLTGESPALGSSVSGQDERGTPPPAPPALPAGAAESGLSTPAPPPPTDERKPFGPEDELIVPETWADWFWNLCGEEGLSDEDITDICQTASAGRTDGTTAKRPRHLRKDEIEAAKRAFEFAIAARQPVS